MKSAARIGKTGNVDVNFRPAASTVFRAQFGPSTLLQIPGLQLSLNQLDVKFPPKRSGEVEARVATCRNNFSQPLARITGAARRGERDEVTTRGRGRFPQLVVQLNLTRLVG